MKETQFIEQNREKWESFEHTLNDPHITPDKLHDLYIQITDDLSHARTFYPSRSVRAYLNSVAQGIFTNLNKEKKHPLSKIGRFFTDELPQVVYESRWSFFWAVAFFGLSFGIGFFSSMMDEGFLKVILGDSYVQMTVENIKKGDPMAVYKSSGRFDMTFGIMANNMRVCLIYFILGIFAGVGSVAMMMYNGIMLGAFLQFFTRYDLAWEANLTVWMHGTLEISAIVIGTAAGITMGRGLLFPGTYTRLQAFQMSARRGVKIMVGVLVMLFFAALIEGNLTRHTELGASRGAFIAINLGAILFYYAWLPFYKAKKGFAQPLREAKLPPDNLYTINYRKIKSSGLIFGDTFLFFSRNITLFLRASALAAIAFCAACFLTSTEPFTDTFKLEADFFTQYTIIAQFLASDHIKLLPAFNALALGTLSFFVYRNILRGANMLEKMTRQTATKKWLQQVFVFGIWSVLHGFGVGNFLLFFFLPYFALLSFMMMRYDFGFNIIEGIQHTFWLISSDRPTTYGTYGTMAITGWLLYSIVNSSLMYFYLWMIGWNLSFASQAQLDGFVVVVMAFFASFAYFLVYMLFFTATGFLFFSLLEINEANSLMERIKQVGAARKIRGLARE
jgi:uncharacterized membrane protein SpoIIM required for sporulation